MIDILAVLVISAYGCLVGSYLYVRSNTDTNTNRYLSRREYIERLRN